MIEMTLTIVQARKLAKAISETSDLTLIEIHAHLQSGIAEHDTAIGAMPWRKVVARDNKNTLHHYDVLECGHKYRLRSSKNYMEDHAAKRRCRQCAP